MPTTEPGLGLQRPIDADVPKTVLDTYVANAFTTIGRTVGPVINARGYGALGDGSNATTELRAAVTAALGVGGTVFIPPGDYVITGPLILNSGVNVRITGPRSARILPHVGAGGAITGEGCTGCVVDGITIDASGAGSAAAGVIFWDSTDCHVKDVEVMGVHLRMSPSGMGLLLDGCTDSTIEHCYLHDNGYGPNTDNLWSLDILINNGCLRCHARRNICLSTMVMGHIGIQDSHWCSADDNDVGGAISNQTIDPEGRGFGYGVYGYSNIVDTPITHCSFSRNTVKGTEGPGVYFQRCQYCTADENILTDTCQVVTGGSLVVGAIAANNLSFDLSIRDNMIETGRIGVRIDCPRTHVTGNRIKNLTGPGVMLAGHNDGSVISKNIIENTAGGIVTGFPDLDISGVTIDHNTITGTTGATAGISLNDVDFLTCDHNTCRSCGGYGLNFSNCNDGDLDNNKAIGCNVSNGGYDGVNVDSTCTGMTLSHMRSTGASQVYGIRLAGSGHTLIDSKVKGNGTGGMIDTATTTTRRGNRYTTGAMHGTATLGTGGTVTVATTEIRGGDTVLVSRLTPGGTVGHLSAPPGAFTAGTNLVINSSDAADRSVVYWEIVH